MTTRHLDAHGNRFVKFIEPDNAKVLLNNILQKRFFDPGEFKRRLSPDFRVMVYNPYTISGATWSSRMMVKDNDGNHIEVHMPHGCLRHKPSDNIKVYLIDGADERRAHALVDMMNHIVLDNNGLRRLVRSECHRR